MLSFDSTDRKEQSSDHAVRGSRFGAAIWQVGHFAVCGIDICIDIVFSGIIQRARGVKSAVETGCSGPSARYLQEADSRSRVAARAGHPSA